MRAIFIQSTTVSFYPPLTASMSSVTEGRRKQHKTKFAFQIAFSYCDKILWPKVTWGGKNLFGLNLKVTICHWGKSRQEFKVEAWSRINSRLILTYYLASFFGSHLAKPICLGMQPPLVDHINHQLKQSITTMSIIQSSLCIPLIDTLSDTIGCVKWTADSI